MTRKNLTVKEQTTSNRTRLLTEDSGSLVLKELSQSAHQLTDGSQLTNSLELQPDQLISGAAAVVVVVVVA